MSIDNQSSEVHDLLSLFSVTRAWLDSGYSCNDLLHAQVIGMKDGAWNMHLSFCFPGNSAYARPVVQMWHPQLLKLPEMDGGIQDGRSRVVDLCHRIFSHAALGGFDGHTDNLKCGDIKAALQTLFPEDIVQDAIDRACHGVEVLPSSCATDRGEVDL